MDMWLEKTAFLGEEGLFILLLYMWENYLGQNMVPVQKNIFFTGHKVCFSIFFQAKEPSVVLLPRSLAGLVQVSALLRVLLAWAQSCG